jgi:membrane protease YdiL (CAAX protease family)
MHSELPGEVRDRRGPGLPESILWTLGYLLAQVLAFVLFLGVFIFAAFGSWPDKPAAIIDLMLEIGLDQSFVPLGVTNLLCLFLIVPAVRLRLGSQARDVLRLSWPTRTHVLLIAGSILPLSIVSEQLYRWSLMLWAWVSEGYPVIQSWSQANAVDAMLRFAKSESYPILVIAIALGPAIGEELVFRALIGNGLIRRWGVRSGMLLTAIVFAGAHGFPPHALATIPIGLYLHYVYRVTGSLSAPVLVHFLNNLLVITLARYDLVERLPASPVVVACALLFVIATARQLQHGSSATPAPVGVRGRPSLATFRSPVLAAAAVVIFTATFVWTAFAAL